MQTAQRLNRLATPPGSCRFCAAAAARAVARSAARRMPVTVPAGVPVHGAQQQQHHQHGATAAALPSDALARLSVAEQQQLISDSIRVIPDFPKPGIMFQDVTSLLLNPAAFQATINLLAARYAGQRIDAVVGFEARGFIFGAPLALALGCAFVPLRKPGKLPGATISESYITEYSTDKIEMHTGAVTAGQRVVLVDDLIATGGTLRAGINLMGKVGAEVVEAACVIELPALQGRAKLGGTPLFVLIEKEGE